MKALFNLDVLFCLIESFIMMGFMCYVLELRIKHRYVLPIPYILYAYLSIWANGFGMIPKMIFMIVSASAICVVMFRDNIWVKIGCSIHSFYIFAISDIIIADIIALINQDSIYETISSSTFSAIVFSLIIKAFNAVLFAFSAMIFSKLNKRNYYWICFDIIFVCFLAISMAFAVLYPVVTYNPSEMTLYLFLSLLFFISSFLILFLFMKLSQYTKKEHYWTVINLKNDSLIKQLDLQRTYIDDTNKIRHDIKKMLNTINYLYREKDFTSLDDYLCEISDTVYPVKNVSYSGNQFIDSVINYKITECNAQNIELKLNIAPKIETSLDANDNILIIANLLDNAIEAVSKTTEDNKVVHFSLYNYERFLVVSSKNSFVRDKNKANIFATDKKEPWLHGYGTEIIRDIAKKYNGNVSFEYDQNIFEVVVMIPI